MSGPKLALARSKEGLGHKTVKLKFSSYSFFVIQWHCSAVPESTLNYLVNHLKTIKGVSDERGGQFLVKIIVPSLYCTTPTPNTQCSWFLVYFSIRWYLQLFESFFFSLILSFYFPVGLETNQSLSISSQVLSMAPQYLLLSTGIYILDNLAPGHISSPISCLHCALSLKSQNTLLALRIHPVPATMLLLKPLHGMFHTPYPVGKSLSIY